MSSKAPKHILLSRTDSIGDVVLTLPMAGLLKEFFPGVRISFLGRTYTEPVVSLSAHIDDFLNWDTLSQRDVAAQIEEIKRYRFDVCVHVLPQPDIAKLAAWSGIKRRIGTIRRIYNVGRMTDYVYYSRKSSELHEAQLNAMMLRPLGMVEVPALARIPDYYGFPPYVQLPARFNELVRPDVRRLILHPKSKGSAVEWGEENFVRLAQQMLESGWQVIITGTEAEGASVRELRSVPGITDLTGQCSLTELTGVIHAADVLVAASTGPLHIAAAMGKRAVGLFSERRPIHPGRWAPLGIDSIALTHSVGSGASDTEKDQAIRQILPETVIRAITG